MDVVDILFLILKLTILSAGEMRLGRGGRASVACLVDGNDAEFIHVALQ